MVTNKKSVVIKVLTTQIYEWNYSIYTWNTNALHVMGVCKSGSQISTYFYFLNKKVHGNVFALPELYYSKHKPI